MSIDPRVEEYLAKLDADPQSEEALQALASLAATENQAEAVLGAGQSYLVGRENWAALLAFYSAVATVIAEPPLRAHLFFEMGQIHERHLGRLDDAITAYQEAFRTNPQEVRPLRAARGIYAQHGQMDAVIQLLEIELQVVTDPAAAATAHCELGLVRMEYQQDLDGAEAAFANALGLVPDMPAAVEGLQRVRELRGGAVVPSEEDLVEVEPVAPDYSAGSLPPEAADFPEEDRDTADYKAVGVPPEVVAETGGTVSPPPSTAETEQEDLVEVEPEPVGERPQADTFDLEVVSPSEEAEADEAAAPEAEATAEAEVEEAAAPEEAAEPEAEAEEAAATEAEAEEAAAPEAEEAAEPEAEAEEAAATGEAGEPEAEAEAEEAGEPEAEAEEAGEPEAEAEVEEAAAPEEAAEPEAEAEEAAAEAEAEEAGAPETEAAEAAEPEAEAEEAAAEAEAEEAEAKASEALERHRYWLEQAHVASGGDAADAFLHALAALPPPRDRDAVQELFGQALDAMPESQQLVERLRSRLVDDDRGAWEAVLDLLVEQKSQQIGDATTDRAIYEVGFYTLGDYERAAELAGEEASDDAEVIKMASLGNWRRVHLELASAASKAGDVSAETTAIRMEADIALGVGKTSKAIDSLRKLARRGQLDESGSELLKSLYRQQEKWNPLVDLLKKEAAAADTDAAQKAILREMVKIYRDRLGLDVMVVQTYNAILKIDPTDEEALEALSVKLEEMRRYPDLIDILKRRADAAETDERRIELLLRVANLYVDKFSNQAEAVRSFEQVLEVDPDNRDAIEFLSQMYKQRGDWRKFVEIRRQYVEQLEGPEERVSVLAEIAAAAFDRLRNPQLAEELWLGVLSVDENHAEALEALTKVYDRQKEWAKLADVLERRLAQAEEEERKPLLEKLGSIYGDRLNDTERAVQAYEALVEVDPDHRRAADALKKAYIELQWWDRLEAFFEQRDAWNEYVRILETMAGTQKDPAVTVELLFRSSRVWLERLETESRAVRALERIMSVDSHNREAAELLAGFYEKAKNYRKLREVLAVLLETTVEGEERFTLLVRLARLNRDLRDAGTAFEKYCEAVETLPARVDILDEVEEVAAEVGRWQNLEATYRNALQTARRSEEEADQAAVEALMLRLGRVLDAELKQTGPALECFREVYEENPSSGPAIEALIAIYARINDNEALLDMYHRKLELAEETDERVAILGQIAELLEEGLEDVPGAIEKHLEIVALVPPEHPAHRAGLSSLHRLYQLQEDWSSLAEVIDREIAVTAPDDEASYLDLYRVLGQVHLHKLGDVDAALSAYAKVLDRQPLDEVARGDLEALLDDPANAIAACDVLEPIYEAGENWAAVVNVLEIRLRHTEPTEETLEARKALLSRIVEIQVSRCYDRKAAFDAATRLLALDPADEEVREQLESLAGVMENWADLAEVFEDRLLQLTEGVLDEGEQALAASYAHRVAQLLAELGATERAIDRYRKTLELDPTNRQALDAMAELFAAEQMWEDLLRARYDQIELSEDAEEIRMIRFQIAILYENMLDQSSEAIATYLEILADRPDDREALSALDRLYGQLGRYAELAENLDQQIGLAEPGSEEWCELKCRAAGIWETELADTQRAVETYRDVLEQRSDHAVAIGSLERLMENDAVAGEVSRILGPLYEAAGETGKLVAALEVELKHTDEPSERLALYHRIADLYETGLADAQKAFETLLEAVGEAPTDQKTIDDLYRLADVLGAWPVLIDRFDELAPTLMDPEHSSALYTRLATLAEQKLMDRGQDRAAGYWVEVLDRNPDDSDAIHALERLYRDLRRWPEMVEIILRKIELPEIVADPQRRKDDLYQAATLYEDMLGQKDEAISIFERVIELDATDSWALNELDRLYRETQRWIDLIENCERRLVLMESDEERRDIWYQMGAVFEHQLEDPSRAIEVYQQVLSVFPEDRNALQALEQLYRTTEDYAQLMENLEQQRALAEAPEDALALRFEVGRLLEEKLVDTEGAIVVYAEILEADPTNAQALRALERLLEEGLETARVSAVLGPLYREGQQWTKLIHMYEVLVREAVEPDRRAEYHREIADIFEHQLGDLAGSFQALRKALREVPTELAFADRLESLSRELLRWSDLVELLLELRDEATDPSARIALGKRGARLLERETDRVNAAIDAYRAVVEIDPTDIESWQALDRLYLGQQRWPELADVLQREIDLAESEEDSIALRYRLGELLQSALDEPARAVDVFNEILAIKPGHPDTIMALEGMFMAGIEPREIEPILEPHYREQSDWENLVRLKWDMLTHLDSADQRFDVLCDTAQIATEQLGDERQALTIYGRALAERPSDESIVERLEALAESTGGYAELAEIYRQALRSDPDDFDALRLSLRLAHTLYRKLNDTDGALVWYREALNLDPTSMEALQVLDEIYLQNGQWPELAEVLEQERRQAMSDSDLVSFSFRLAELYQLQLGDIEQAINAYNDVLDADRTHRESLAALQALYQQQGNWEALYDVFHQQSMLADGDEERAEIYRQMAQLADTGLNRPDDAIDLWNRVLEIQADDDYALSQLEALYEQTEQHTELVEVLERRVGLAEAPERQQEITLKIGRTWRLLGNDEEAINAYRRMLELAPGNAEALFALRELYEHTSQYEALCETLAEIIRLGYLDPDGLLAAYLRLGELYGDYLNRPEDAVEAWRWVLQLRPEDPQALDKLERFYLELERWEDAVAVLHEKVERAADPYDRIDLLLRIAELWQTKVENNEQAAAAYSQLLLEDPTNDVAFLALEDIYRQTEDWEPLTNLYLNRKDHVGDSLDRIQLLRRASEVFETKMSQPELAFVAMAGAFTEDPLDPQTADKLEELADASDQWEQLVQLYEVTIQGVVQDRGEEVTLDLHRRVATYYREKVGQTTLADAHYLKVLDIEPSNEAAFKALETIYAQEQRWDELVVILRRRLELPLDPTEQIELYLKMGTVQKESLGQLDEAIASFKAVLDIDPNHVEALGHLEQIYEARADWKALIEVLEHWASITYEPDQMVAMKYRCAQLWEDQLGVAERAIDVYTEILTDDPGHVPALDALERLYLAREQWDRYIEILERRIDLVPPEERRIEILMEMARVHVAELREPDRAIDCYREVLEIQPGQMDAVTALVGVYSPVEYWDDLATMLAEQVGHVDDPAAKVELLSSEGRVARDSLGDMFRAIQCYERVQELDPGNADALNALADLYEQVGQWDECIEVYNKLIIAAPDVPTRTSLLCHVGQIYEQNILDDEAAMERYQAALDQDPGYAEALEALRRLHEKREEWPQAIQMLKSQAQYSRELTERSKLLAEVGRIYEEQLNDRPASIDYFEKAIDLDPQNPVAAAPLAELYLNQKKWARAMPLLEVLIKSDSYADNDEGLNLLHFNLGLCAEELGQEDRALGHYRDAYELKRNHLPTLDGLARLYLKREDMERAFLILEDILTQFGHELPEAKVAEIFSQQADLKLRVGERRAAQELYEKALFTNPNDKGALRRMVEVLERQEEWAEVVEYQMRLAEASDDTVEKFKLYVDAGDHYKEHLGQMQEAIDAYKKAVSVDPSSKVVLQRLLNIFHATEDWDKAAQILGKLAELETDPERHAKYCLTIAYILRDNLNDTERAIAYFNRTLDADLHRLEAFQAIDTILTQERNWKELERSYRRMIKRATEHEGEDLKNLKLMLWQNLGEIYRSRLQQLEEAVAAFKIAARLDPQNVKAHEILADLYERVEGHQDEAIKEHHTLIGISPFRFESYQALFARYIDKRDFDAAWCLAGALVLWNEASDQEREYYQRYLAPKLPLAKRQLSPEQWQLLYHPDQPLALGKIMEIFANYMRHAISYDLKSMWKVHKKKDMLDLSNQQILFSRIFNYGVRILQAPACNVYVHKGELGGIRNANVDPPALVIGRRMVSGREERDLAFSIGKALCLMRPEHYLGSAYPVTDNLKLFFYAAHRVTNPNVPLAVQSSDLDNLVKELSKTPPVMVAVQRATQAYLDQGENPNFSVWLKTLDYTSDRVGLLLCGDLGQAVNCIRNEEMTLSKAETKDRIKEIVLFGVSPEYLALRKELGLAIRSS